MNRKTQLRAARKAANQSSPVGTNKRTNVVEKTWWEREGEYLVEIKEAQVAAIRYAGGHSPKKRGEKKLYIFIFRFHTKSASCAGTIEAPDLLSALEKIQAEEGYKLASYRQLEIEREDWVE